MRPFKITAERAEELERVVAIPTDDVDKILKALDSHELSLEFEKITDCVATVVGEKLAGVLTLHVTSVAMLADKPDRTLDEVISALRKGLENFGWDDEKLQSFDNFRGNLEKLASNMAFYVGAKAASLVRQTGRHLHEIKSIVDTMPIFDLERKSIEAAILITNLSMTLSDSNEEETQINLILDHEDLTRIRDECNLALEKLSALESALGAGAIGKVIVYGRRVG